MKPPKLRPNESVKSFKARVAKWEKSTGKKYPRSFSEQSNEERILKGNPRIGLGKTKDYSSNYDDEIKESQTNKARTNKKRNTTSQDAKDTKKERSLETLGKTDFSKVKLPPSEKAKIKPTKETKETPPPPESKSAEVKISKNQNNQTVLNESSPKAAKTTKKKLSIKSGFSEKQLKAQKRRLKFKTHKKASDLLKLRKMK